jgi:2-methylcitrate dehydratase
MPCRIHITLKDGRTFSVEKQDYQGFYTHPMSWDQVAAKFEWLSSPYTNPEQRASIIQTVAHLEAKDVAQLSALLGASTVRDY